MESVILLSSSENTRQVEEEEKSRFVRSIMDSLGLDTEGIWDDEGELSIENKIKFKQLLIAYNIQIISNIDGTLAIYHVDEGNDDLIAEWRKPKYVLKKDHSQKDPKKRLYLEMHLSYQSVFDE